MRADAVRLRQALHNLIKNALEAIGDARKPQIVVSTRIVREDEQDWVELAVADNGPGLPAGFGERWFEPYTTSKNKGTGLGLAVVKKIAEEHGGSIRAENRAQGGAVFTLRLPIDVTPSATRQRCHAADASSRRVIALRLQRAARQRVRRTSTRAPTRLRPAARARRIARRAIAALLRKRAIVLFPPRTRTLAQHATLARVEREHALDAGFERSSDRQNTSSRAAACRCARTPRARRARS